MAQDRMKILEERLTRLEATLAQRGTGGGGGGAAAAIQPGPIADPATFAATLSQLARIQPQVDPAPWTPPWWFGNWGRYRWPIPIFDPITDMAPIADPATFARSAATAATIGRIGPQGGDPPPPDLTRFTAVQLESMLHSINAEKARLDSMEAMVKKQMESTKQ